MSLQPMSCGNRFQIMEFKVKLVRRNVPSEELPADVIRVAHHIGRKTVTIEEYNEHGSFNATTLQRRF